MLVQVTDGDLGAWPALSAVLWTLGANAGRQRWGVACGAGLFRTDRIYDAFAFRDASTAKRRRRLQQPTGTIGGRKSVHLHGCT